jgi:hypothetical protein
MKLPAASLTYGVFQRAQRQRSTCHFNAGVRPLECKSADSAPTHSIDARRAPTNTDDRLTHIATCTYGEVELEGHSDMYQTPCCEPDPSRTAERPNGDRRSKSTWERAHETRTPITNVWVVSAPSAAKTTNTRLTQQMSPPPITGTSCSNL